jgi:hypothetical protein
MPSAIGGWHTCYAKTIFLHLNYQHLKSIAMKFFITVLAALILFACNKDEKSEEPLDRLRKVESAEKAGFKSEEENKQTAGFTDSTANYFFQTSDKKQDDKAQKQIQSQPKSDWDKKIIKTATLNLEVKEYNSFYKSIREKVSQLGGYVAQEEQSQTSYKIENTLIVKVPVDQFDNALLQVTTGVEKINEKKITSEDVTGEVVDTKSRMEAKRQIRQRYIDLLKQAKNMEEVLNVQSEINDIQEDLESASGRVNYLTHSAAYSTINLTFYQVLNEAAKNSDKISFSSRLSNAFKTGWGWVGEIFVGIISIWPLLLMIIAVIFYFKRNKAVRTKTA